ncbi:Na+/H+ antiporter subunit E [Alkalibacillus haloalkaliphilus]|uniref:Na(+)/H(+) antiporter subunit E n=1 Tax=Alkalibacillus haloalkaliphilus TaxID=94136 RepID=A0A511W5V3_9BACI|nr:Na+/H+ antiporter subunit E [Alkalibacillus haloalkaliphilus]GEN46466.1 Na(+)/H(+) antiporter subunit E [Alkalibacillus haloalkaliphilus]
MAIQIIFNLLIAVMWMFLSESYTVLSFFIGLFIGMGLLFFLRRFVPDIFYVIRLYRIVKLNLIFLRELILSSVSIVALAYKPKLDIEPGIFALPIEVKSSWEIALLGNLISLTPGTLSVAVADDNSKIYIHAMDLPDVEASITEIKETFEKAIMEVTR